ncbi:MAG: hypothetical protein AB1391_02925 [Candidatus Micrarchaeota archaeon]
MKEMKAQSSFEVLITVAILIAFSIPIILAALAISQLRLDDFSLSHGKATVQYLSDNINEVYLEGNASKRTILLDFPSNTKNLTISNHTIILYLTSSSGVYEISHPFFADTTDFSIAKRGIASVVLSMNNGKVNLSNG